MPLFCYLSHLLYQFLSTLSISVLTFFPCNYNTGQSDPLYFLLSFSPRVLGRMVFFVLDSSTLISHSFFTSKLNFFHGTSVFTHFHSNIKTNLTALAYIISTRWSQPALSSLVHFRLTSTIDRSHQHQDLE